MALHFDGRESHLENGWTCYGATDVNTGEYIPVHVSSEALEDHGKDAVQYEADNKHNAGIFGPKGIIIVRKQDFL